MSDQDQTPQTQEIPAETQPPQTEAPESKGRQMSFSILETGVIRAEFGAGIEPLEFNPGSVPEAIQADVMAEGIMSRARGYTSKLTGDSRTPLALRGVIAKAFENFGKGVWKIERTPGEGTSEISMEVQAAFEFRKMRAEKKGEEFTGTLHEAAENWATLSDEQKKTLKALTLYQLAMQKVKERVAAERVAKLQAKAAKEETEDVGF